MGGLIQITGNQQSKRPIMSIVTCHECSDYVDTDEDGEAYCLTNEDGTITQLEYCLCVNCRESRMEGAE